MAGRLLADLGAEVLKIEPPGGADTRRLPPFEQGPAGDSAESLYWASVGVGKRSLVLDLERVEDRESLENLASTADVLIESYDPGVLGAMGLGHEALSSSNPRLIYASITPFGQQGPKAHWPATELTIEAAGGRVALQGDPDRPPLPLGFPHAAFHAGAQAAADILIALNERQHSDRGQYLDTSMQEVMVWTLMGPYGWPVATGLDPPGTADDRGDTDALPQMARQFPRLLECADGWIAVGMAPLGQSKGGGIIPRIMRELSGKGSLEGALAEIDWDRWEETYHEGTISDEVVHEVVEQVKAVLATRTKKELVQWTIEHKLRLGAVRTTRDLLHDEHLEARQFFRRVGNRRHPGLPARSTVLDRTELEPAPRLGEHQHLVGRAVRRPQTSRPESGSERLGEAFEGLKVADFSWVVAGPTMGKALADHGATVVRVESERRPDLARRLPPFKDEVEGLNRSQWAAMFNTSKLSLALDLSMPEGVAVARRLAGWADVILESFSPGTMKRLGLDYETLSSGRSDLVMLSTSLFGSGGPLSPFVGYGQQAAAMVGLHAITGWKDRAPCGPYGPYTDVIAPKFGICALAAAILRQRSTGRGQYIELSQGECGIRFIEPLLLDEVVNGRTATARGMDSDRACPHGIYATRAIERYIAIAVENEAQWRALLAVAPLADFHSPELCSLAARIAAREAIEEALHRWCREQEHRELESRLVAAGVPASVVQRPTDLLADPHLKARGFRQILEHGEIGSTIYDGFATRFSAKETMLHSAAPCLGEHTHEVLHDLLGLSEAEIEELEKAGVLT